MRRFAPRSLEWDSRRQRCQVFASTISRSAARATAARSESAPAIPRLTLAPAGGANGEADLVAVRVIGEGGMGVVHLAEQRSLAREVAVKTVRTNDARITEAIVREARVMGGLEHPNVVPVHALGRGESDAPLLVMKRIEGTSWRTLLHDDAHDAWEPLLAGHGDRLRAHTEILMQVARALAFAHERGVIHRDVKPDNVMIGRFGEVYLLDWGIALRLDERAHEPFGIVGTPGYMAPEMVAGDPNGIDARTDVYLLGATLFEILSRRVPHDAQTPLGALSMSLLGERSPLPAATPTDAVDLIDAAMALHPDARPASAEVFRVGLARFLASREAEALVRDARAARSDAVGDADGPTGQSMFRALVESRFAFGAALRLRPNDAAIGADLDATLRLLVEREVALGNVEGARMYASEMRSVPSELLESIEAAARERGEQRDAAKGMRRERAERDVSHTSPFAAGLWIAALVLTFVWVLSRGDAGTLPSPTSMLQLHAVLLLIGLPLLAVFRRRVFAKLASRRLLLFIALWAAIAPMFAAVDLLRGRAFYDPLPAFVAGLVLTGYETAVHWAELWPSLALQASVIATCIVRPSSVPAVIAAFFVINVFAVLRALRLRAERTAAPTSRT